MLPEEVKVGQYVHWKRNESDWNNGFACYGKIMTVDTTFLNIITFDDLVTVRVNFNGGSLKEMSVVSLEEAKNGTFKYNLQFIDERIKYLERTMLEFKDEIGKIQNSCLALQEVFRLADKPQETSIKRLRKTE